MTKTLLVTNDFPPTIGGIQSYLRDFVATLEPSSVAVFASVQDAEAARAHDEDAEYRIIRWPRKVMLPTPTTADFVAQAVRDWNIDTVWFGASAPLGLLAPAARRAGARKIVSTTHGHEVGWSMTPGARQTLRRIANHSDVVTYISDYTLARIRPAMGEHPDYAHLPSAVDAEFFRPATTEQRTWTRTQLGFGEEPVVVCISRLVPRKGQDKLIQALPQLRKLHPGTRLVIVGTGPYEKRLRALVDKHDVADAVTFTGPVPGPMMRDVLAAADVFAMPARTRGGGLDVEGLGIVYLEAQACGVPVVAGDSGGAPETVADGTGIVVDGTNVAELTAALDALLSDASLRADMGQAGRNHVLTEWTWEVMGARLRSILG